MNVWRIVAHHERPAEMAEWSRREGVIAIGWGGMGDLRQRQFRNEVDLTRLVANSHASSSVSNYVNGGRSLWRLYNEMQKGDLVIVSASGWRALTMRVMGDYYYVGEREIGSYEHRRKAEVVQIDPSILWHIAGGKAPGENIRRTLIRCAKTLSEADFKALAE